MKCTDIDWSERKNLGSCNFNLMVRTVYKGRKFGLCVKLFVCNKWKKLKKHRGTVESRGFDRPMYLSLSPQDSMWHKIN